jgi:hypothetical protein
MMLLAKKRLKVLQQPNAPFIRGVDTREQCERISVLRRLDAEIAVVATGKDACRLTPDLEGKIEISRKSDGMSAYTIPLVRGYMQERRAGAREVQELFVVRH